jgi:hypothetical protein
MIILNLLTVSLGLISVMKSALLTLFVVGLMISIKNLLVK